MEQLSKSEKQIMDTFWNSPQPLPASDLLSACVGRTWKARSVFPLVKKLIEKGVLAEVGCVMFDLQDEPDAFTVYQGEVQAIPQTLLNRKVDCWEVENNTLHIFVLDSELTEDERWKLLHES